MWADSHAQHVTVCTLYTICQVKRDFLQLHMDETQVDLLEGFLQNQPEIAVSVVARTQLTRVFTMH